MKLKEVRKILLAAALLSVVSVGGIFAYFTDTESIVNTVRIADFATSLTEPEWDKVTKEEKTTLTPGKVISKDPQVTNEGSVDAFIFLEVTIPVKKVVTVTEEGIKHPSELQELFFYNTEAGWTQIGSFEKVMENGSETAHKYTYVYGNNNKCEPLKPKEVTPPLFRQIRFLNIAEGQGLDGSEQNVSVEEYAIQTTDLGADSTVRPSDVLKILKNQRK